MINEMINSLKFPMVIPTYVKRHALFFFKLDHEFGRKKTYKKYLEHDSNLKKNYRVIPRMLIFGIQAGSLLCNVGGCVG